MKKIAYVGRWPDRVGSANFLSQIYEEYFCLWGIFHSYLAYKQVGRETYRDS